MILDSGNRTEYSTGAVRDVQIGKGRCDLLPLTAVAQLFADEQKYIINKIGMFIESGNRAYLINALDDFVVSEEMSLYEAILEASKHYQEGAIKYGERNWEKGIPLHSFIDSGVRHILKHWNGERDERHDRAFVWNIEESI